MVIVRNPQNRIGKRSTPSGTGLLLPGFQGRFHGSQAIKAVLKLRHGTEMKQKLLYIYIYIYMYIYIYIYRHAYIHTSFVDKRHLRYAQKVCMLASTPACYTPKRCFHYKRAVIMLEFAALSILSNMSAGPGNLKNSSIIPRVLS